MSYPLTTYGMATTMDPQRPRTMPLPASPSAPIGTEDAASICLTGRLTDRMADGRAAHAA